MLSLWFREESEDHQDRGHHEDVLTVEPAVVASEDTAEKETTSAEINFLTAL